MSFWEGILGGGAALGGYGYLLDDLAGQRDDVGNTISDLTTSLTGADSPTQFVPWGVSSGMGNLTATREGLDYNLSPEQQMLSDQMSQGAGNMFQQAGSGNEYLQNLLTPGRAGATDPHSYGGLGSAAGDALGLSQQAMASAGQDPYQREQDVYERIRATQIPEEQRYQQAMNERMYRQGRTGMQTDTYGGTGEQFAYEKARAEAQNNAMLSAMGQSQKEMMNQASMGSQFGQLGSGLMGQQQNLASQNVKDIIGLSGLQGDLSNQQTQAGLGMLEGSYLPYKNLMGLTGQGLGNQELGQQTDMNRANLLSQLGLGGLGTEVNYSNIMGNAFGNAVGGLSQMARGVGGDIDATGKGIWEWIKGL